MLFFHCQWTPLHVAAERASLATVECLVDKGANIDIEDGFEVSL